MFTLVVNTSLNPGCCFAEWSCKNYHCLCRADSLSATVFLSLMIRFHPGYVQLPEMES